MRIHALVVAVAMFVTASSASARTFVVRADGSGDVPTIQAGLDSMATGFHDTLIVMPGTYDERLALPADVRDDNGTVLCPGGPAQTRITALRGTVRDRPHITIHGASFADSIALFGFASQFDDCVFLGTLLSGDVNGNTNTSEFHGCEFHGATTLLHCVDNGVRRVTDCRFVNARLFASSDAGTFTIAGCSFIGPPSDTAATLGPTIDNGIDLVDCRFSGMAVAVAWTGREGETFTEIRRSTFENVTEDAVWIPSLARYQESYASGRIVIDSCRFERCGRALHISSGKTFDLDMVSDTIRSCTTEGVRAALLRSLRLDQVSIVGSSGLGASIGLSEWPISPSGSVGYAPRLSVSGCTFDHNGGSGLIIDDSTHVRFMANSSTALSDVEASDNHGDGIALQLRTPSIVGIVSGHNSGDGLRLTSTAVGGEARVDSTTVVANAKAGLEVSGTQTGAAVVAHVLAAFNGGAGISVPAAFGSVAADDAWQNSGGNFVNASADSNLVADPLFCNTAAGDYHVDAVSPAAPSGPYGQIGALGVGCRALHANAFVMGPGTIHRGGHGFVDLALLSSASFDATTIDPSTAVFAVAPLASQPHAASVRDVNHDGLADEVLRFSADALSIPAGATSATLTATTFSGESVTATVAIQRDGPPKSQQPVAAAPTVVLALRAVAPAVLEIVAPDAAPARLLVVDVSGRAVLARDVAPSAAAQRIDLATQGLKPGFYLARLRQAGAVVRTKLLILR